jgi:hypothetical protein
MFGCVGAIFNGLRSEIMETKSSPNQGVLFSIRNAIFVGMSVGMIVGLFFRQVLVFELREALAVGLFFWLIGVLWFGGLDVIQHYTLRLILIIQGHTPADYARFLDYAVDRIFLQKVGGGYRFIHRLLLEHFAEMGEAKQV